MELESDKTTSTLAKLQLVKEIRSKTIHMYNLKETLIKEIESTKREERNLNEYRAEMEALNCEKLAHVEELRAIHADISSMESVIKQAEVSKQRSIETAKRLHAEYLPLKSDVDRLRQSCLGLERLPELHEDEPSVITFELFDQQMPMNQQPPKTQNWPTNQNLQRDEVLLNFQQQQQTAAFIMSHQQSPLLMPSQSTSSKQPNLPPSHPNSAPSFRQQPPPMKNCLSCMQQIHRNAPICPLCKAKSRSRNPKKPKKKD